MLARYVRFAGRVSWIASHFPFIQPPCASQPYLDSRARLRTLFRDAIRDSVPLPQLWSQRATNGLESELLLSSGTEYRERNDGRIDLQLPWEEVCLHPLAIF